MFMWMMIMYTTLALTGAALVYLSDRVSRFGLMSKLVQKGRNAQVAAGSVIVFALFVLVGLVLNFMNAIICAIYFALSWLISDLLFGIISKIRRKKFAKYYAGGVAVLFAISALVSGWYQDNHVWKTEYTSTTDKNVKDIKVLMFADSHINTTFDGGGFAHHVESMQAQNPDIVIVAGDFVDDGTDKENMVSAVQALGKMKTTYGVYFVFGNHDKGYYGPERRGFSAVELVKELENNGIKVLRDEAVLLDDMFYVIGRKDYSEIRERGGKRASMDELVRNLDKSKYMIVADHQPADYENQAKAKVDLVLSGHTHGGQLFPFNYVGKWIGANDAIYGLEKRGNTDFIVTSGISDWAIKFKTGTKSEYVVINVEKK